VGVRRRPRFAPGPAQQPRHPERLKQETKTGSPGWRNIIEAAGGWDGIVLGNARNHENAKYVGKSLAVVAKEMKKDPRDAAWDLVLAGGGRVTAIYHMMGEGDVQMALNFPWVSIGSDADASLNPGAIDATGLPHPHGYRTHPRIIAQYVRKEGLLTLPEAIRKMTSWPATRMKLANRGSLKEGNWADVVIFDYDTIQDESTWAEPVKYPSGIDYVLVNGQFVTEHGKHSGAKPGMPLYGPGKQ
jgi:N-acyl-D-aspartate/D-glutamate deacylase